MPNIKARVFVAAVAIKAGTPEAPEAVEVNLNAQASNGNPAHPNASWAQRVPSAQLTFIASTPAAIAAFQPDAVFDIEFKPVA